MLRVVTGKNCRIIELKGISIVSISFFISYLMNPGEVNQISSFRSKNLPSNQRPEADDDESSPESGVCPRLLKTLRGLSPSSPLCQDDKLSFQASRWPFVCDDLLIFFSPPLAWLFILLLIAVVLRSSTPGEKVGRTAAASKEGKKRAQRDPETERNVDGKFHSVSYWPPTELSILLLRRRAFRTMLKSFSP